MSRSLTALILISAVLSVTLALAGPGEARMPVPIADLPALDGTPAAPPVTAGRWRQALHELHLASLVPLPWPTAGQVRAQAVAARDEQVVPIAVLDAAYSRLLAPPNDYALARLFAATALVPDTYQGEAVTFVLPRQLYLATDPDLSLRVDIDFADGSGWRQVTFDQPLTVTYAATGTFSLRLRATRPDGRVLWSAFPFTVVALRTPQPTATWPLTADIPYQGSAAGGEAFVYLAEGHATLTNPLVVVEGFDLDDSMGWEVLYTLLNQENLIEDLRAEGYDAVILNFTSATDYMQRNAFLLVKLLQTVQAAIDPGQPYAVVGASMGGQVGRYALAYMEQHGLPHQVSTFIAFDSPNRGANIPLGMQYWLDFFQDESEDAAFLLSRLDMPAARQLLLYHHTSPPGPTGVADPLRAAFLADLAAAGDYPAQPRLVAIANGSGAQAGQGFAPGEQIVRWEYSSFLVDITGNIWAVPDGNSHVIFDGEINLIWPLPDEYLTVTVAGTLPWDNAPGGSRASMLQMDAVAAPYGDIIALYPAHAFIPTISALALDVTDPFYDIAGDGDLLARTPFDAVYYPLANQDHVTITPENKAWFLDEIHGELTAVASAAPAPQLLGNRPNPFNPRTVIAFTLPDAAAARLQVFDLRGRLVRTLADDLRGPGRREVAWDGRDARGRDAGAGVYVYRLESVATRACGRMTLVR